MSRHINFYAGTGLDRAGEHRPDEAWLARHVSDPRSRLVPFWRAQNLFRLAQRPEAAPIPVLPTVAEAGALLHGGGTPPVLLGLAEGIAYFALDLSHIEDPAPAAAAFGGGEFADLRRYGVLLGQREGALLAYARGMLHWHGRHRFCGACGSPTESSQAGHVRICTSAQCQAQHFPRTDPAVIMLVTSGDHCLLGRQQAWPPGMHSTLAGFVEPGESLEEAVAREVYEETGVRVREAHYHSSQPWPFPGSIMLGFQAEAESMALAVNRTELEDARWFMRRTLLESPEDERFRLPRRDSIARRLIEGWLGRG